MKKKIIYTDEPMGEFKIIKDFLPPPEEFARALENVRVTVTLSRSSVEFFKKIARKHKTRYQTMIRKVLDNYVQHFDR